MEGIGTANIRQAVGVVSDVKPVSDHPLNQYRGEPGAVHVIGKELRGRTSIVERSAEAKFRLLINGSLATLHLSLDEARKAASAIGRSRATTRSSTLRISVETAECEEVYALVIINECVGSPSL